ncbi:MAG: restriction endonuclease subunit S [candidate division WOR-3 bacterium]|nr:restriction endonuclease subunit S [Thermoproteota archaeon]
MKGNGFKETEIGLIPEDWEVVRLGEVAHIKLGSTPERKEKKYWENGSIPWVKIQDLNNSVIYDTSEKISDIAFKEKFKGKFVPKGTLLLSFKLSIGKVGILGIDAVHHEGIASLFLKEEIVSKKFLFYLLQSLDYENLLDTYVKGKTLNKEKLKILPIPLPPLSEQQKIAKVLDKIQQAIELQDKIIELLKNLKKSLMQKLFTEGLYGEEQKETEIGHIPKSWEVVRLGEVIHYKKGKKPKILLDDWKDDYLPYLTAEFFRTGKPDKFVDIKTERNIEIVEPEDIVLIWDGSNAGDTFTGLKGVLASTMVKIEILDKSKVDKKLIYYFLRTKFDLLNARTTGSTIPHVSKMTFENLLIPLPPLEEQKQIAHILSTVDKKIEVEQRRKEVLKDLFKTMLHKLMSGEIRLKEVEI